MDALKNFAYSLVATAPSPATSGTSLIVTTGQGSYFPATPFDATIWPAGVQPSNTNAEIVRVTNVSTDTLTITRAQYGTTAQAITVGYQIAQTVDANLLSQLAPLSGATFTGEVVAPDFKASGLTGATTATRYVGGTVNGAPTSGTFAVGDFIVDQTGTIWVCTTAGTPGTWTTTISSHLSLRTASATVGRNEITIFSGSTASQTLTAPSNPIDGSNWTVINKASVAVTLSFTPSMIPLSSGTGVTTFSVPAGGSYSFVNYNGSQWYMVATNSADQLINVLPTANGGTGLSTIGTAGQVLTVNSGATALQYSTPATPIQTAVPALPSANGFTLWTVDPIQTYTPSSTTSGATYTYKFVPTQTINLTTSNLFAYYQGTATTVVTTYGAMALYDASGNRLAISSSTTFVGSTTTGLKTSALSTNVTLNAGQSYFLAFLWVGSGTVALAGTLASNNASIANMNISAPATGSLAYRAGVTTSTTSLQSPYTSATTATNTFFFLGII